jgi:hypothetical protein
MAELERLTAEEVVRHLLEDEAGADLVRESLRWLVGQLGGRGHRPDQRGARRAHRGSSHLAQRLPSSALGYARRRARAPKRELMGLHEQAALTVFEQIEVGDGAFPVRAPDDVGEPALPKHERQALGVVQPLVAGAADPLLDEPPHDAGRVAVRSVLRTECVGSGGLFSEQRRPAVAVVANHLLKVRCGESQDSARPEDAPTLAEECECLPTAQVFDHMSGIAKLRARVGRGDTLGHVRADYSRREATDLLPGQETHPPQRPSEQTRSAEENRRRLVDIDPAGDDIRAAAEMQSRCLAGL